MYVAVGSKYGTTSTRTVGMLVKKLEITKESGTIPTKSFRNNFVTYTHVLHEEQLPKWKRASFFISKLILESHLLQLLLLRSWLASNTNR